MLSPEDYKEIRALRRQGWSVSAIARRLGRDRKTVRAYVRGERTAGVRAVRPSEFFRFVPYCRQRLDEDPHLQANALHREIVELGYTGAYSTFTRALRTHLTRPACGCCRPGTDRPVCGTVEDVQFDWVQLPAPPVEWDCGARAYVLVGSLTRSGRWRAGLAAADDLPHYVEAVDQVLRRLGGTGARWLFDRTPPVCSPAGKVAATFHEIATYYGASIAIRPQTGPSVPAARARRAVVLHWWDTAADDVGMQEAQDSLDRLAERSDSWRRRAEGDVRLLLPLPSKPFPARVRVQRTVGPHGSVSFEGNHYMLPACLAGSEVGIRRRLDEPYLSVTTPHGAVIACFPRAPRGAGRTIAVRSGRITLERPVRLAGGETQSCTAGGSARPLSRAAPAEARALSGCEDGHPAGPAARDEEQEGDPPLPREAGSGTSLPRQSKWTTEGHRAPRRRLPPGAGPDREAHEE